MISYISAFVTGFALALGSFFGITHNTPSFGATSPLTVFQGGTGSTSPSGILIGDNGVTPRLKTLTIGTNLTLTGTTLNASGGSGGGTGNVATSSGETSGQLSYWTSTNATPATLGKVATTSLTASGVLSLSNAISVIGGSASALTVTGGSNGQVLAWLNGLPAWTASSSVAAGTGISVATAGAVTTVTNTGVISLGNGTGVTCTGTAPGSCSLAAIAQGVLGNNAAASTIPTSQSTSTLFGSGTAGKVLAIDSAGNAGWAATTTFASGTGISLSLLGNQLTITNSGVLTTRSVNTTYPLKGGGALSADLTLSSDLSTTTTNIWSGANMFTNASTTIVGNATTTGTFFATTASSTNFFSAGLSTCNSTSFLQWSGGTFGCGTPAGGAGFAYPFVTRSNFGTTTAATSTVIWAQQGIFASSTSVFGTTTALAGLFGRATTTKQVGGSSEAIGIQQDNANGTAIFSAQTNQVNAEWLVQVNGLMGWGAGGASDQDINLYRSGTGALTVQSATTNSTDAFRVNQASGGTGTAIFTVNTTSGYVSTPWLLVNGAGGGAKLDVYGGGTTALRAQQTAASDVAFSSFVTSDAQLRFSFLTDGTLKWGTGAAVADVQLSRTAVGSLGLQGISANSTTAFSVLTAMGTNVFDVDTSNQLVGIGSSTPWAVLSVASSTYNYLNPLFVIATSSNKFGQIFTVLATSSASYKTDPTRSDIGVRVSIGASPLVQDLPLDQLAVEGRINQKALYANCDHFSSFVTQLTGDTNNVCGNFAFNEDTAAVLDPAMTSASVVYARVRTGTAGTVAAAGDGGAITLQKGGSSFISVASSTPVAEVIARIGVPQNASSSIYFIGFADFAGVSGDVTSAPQDGCAFTASSTASGGTWYLFNRNSGTQTYVDTTVASSTNTTGVGDFYKFRIEVSTNLCIGYITNLRTGVTTKTLTAANSNGWPNNASLLASVSNVSAGLTNELHVRSIRLWLSGYNEPQ